MEVHGGEELERFEGAGDRVSEGGHEERAGARLRLRGDRRRRDAGRDAREGAPGSRSARRAACVLGAARDARCPGIYAAGDICEYDSPVHGRPMRIEHWDVAFNQGKTAALNMLGRGVEHDVVPYFFSDLADWTSMEYVGPGSGEPVIRGSIEEGEFTAFYVDDGRVTAALTVGRSDDLDFARSFISSGRRSTLPCWRSGR